MVIDKGLRHRLSAHKSRLHGEFGLVTAIVVQAVIDSFDGNESIRNDALDYFQSDTFRQHLSWLDLPEDCQITILN